MLKRAHGFTLIEILISLFLTGLILAELASSQLFAFTTNRSSYYFAVAANQMHNMQEQLSVQFDESEITQIMTDWNSLNRMLLPAGRSEYADNKLTIYWGDKSVYPCDKVKLGRSGCITD